MKIVWDERLRLSETISLWSSHYPGWKFPHKSDGDALSSHLGVYFGEWQGVWDGKSLYLPIQVSVSTVHKEIQKMPTVTLNKQKSPLAVSLSLSHTHIGLPWGFNLNFPTSIPVTYGSPPPPRLFWPDLRVSLGSSSLDRWAWIRALALTLYG